MNKAYIYPLFPLSKISRQSPYIENFIDSFSSNFIFLNKEKPLKNGIFDILKYLGRIQYIFLNWIEDIPDKKGGWLQTYAFIILLGVFKLLKIKVIWVMHNKLSHYKSNLFLKRILFKLMIHKSDFIITHSKEGIRYLSDFKFKRKHKLKYEPHPIENKLIDFNAEIEFDILIWGAIIPYKGIDKLLKYLYEKKLQDKYKLLIIGKVKPDTYAEIIKQYCKKNIILENRYIPVDELIDNIKRSRMTVFTYENDSVLSSGALMDTLSYGGYVIGPYAGAFKDVAEENLIMTYKDYNELIELIDQRISGNTMNLQVIRNFIEENNWHKFSNRVINWINQQNHVLKN